MEKAKRVAKNTGFLYARMGITVFMSLYSTRLVLKALGVVDFGTFSLVAGIVTMLTFLNAAMRTASQRYMSFAQGEGNKLKQKQIFNVSVVLHGIMAILVVLLIEVMGYFLFESVLKIPTERLLASKTIFHFMVITTFISIISVPYYAIINAHENMFIIALIGVVESILKLGIAFFITYTLYDKLIMYGLLMSLVTIFVLIFIRIYCHRKYEEVEINIRLYYDKPLYKDMGSFAGWSVLGSGSSMISNYGQGIVLNMFFGPALNAAQGIANQVSGQLGAFSTTMLSALNPLIAKSEGAGNRKNMLHATIMGSKFSFLLLTILYVPILVEMPIIFKFWLGEIPEFAIVFCRLLLLNNLIKQIFLPLTSSIAAVGRIKNFQIYSSILNFLPLGVILILFSNNFEPYVLYIVFITFSIIRGGLILYYANKECDLSIRTFSNNVIIRCFVAFLLNLGVALIPSFIIIEDILRVIITTGISLFSFFIIVWHIGFSRFERQNISNFFKTINLQLFRLKKT